MSEAVAAQEVNAGLSGGEMLLLALAAMPVKRVNLSGWFQRKSLATAGVISRTEDVSDVLLRMPQNWNIVESARNIRRIKDVYEKEQVVDLLKSIETGDATPAAYININRFVSSNRHVMWRSKRTCAYDHELYRASRLASHTPEGNLWCNAA